MSPRRVPTFAQALSFIEAHGIVLESAHGRTPREARALLQQVGYGR